MEPFPVPMRVTVQIRNLRSRPMKTKLTRVTAEHPELKDLRLEDPELEGLRLEDPELHALLARCSAPAPPPGLFERTLRHAANAAQRERQLRRQKSRRLYAGFGALVAASVVLVVGTTLATDFLRPDAGELPMVSVSLYEPETVRLVFAADSPLADATMTVTLPEGIELAGFPGEREIRWETSLNEGRNLLPLTLIATRPAGGALEARLQHDARDRTFRLWIDVG